MAYGGVKNDKKRADLMAYLASLSAAPKPFPAP
jgi:cytochrome c2